MINAFYINLVQKENKKRFLFQKREHSGSCLETRETTEYSLRSEDSSRLVTYLGTYYNVVVFLGYLGGSFPGSTHP